MMVSLRKGGFGKVDVVVIVVALVLFAIMISPFFIHRKIRDYAPLCEVHLRQLVVAAQMYAYDHDGRWPGADWVTDLNVKAALDKQIFQCNADKKGGGRWFISYGYSGLLLRADGSGVHEKQFIRPQEVGAFCDATPTNYYPDGGIIGGGGLQPRTKVVRPETRHGNKIYLFAAFTDGHVEHQRGPFNVKDLANETTRSFYLASALGYIDNPVGGMSDFTPRMSGTGPVAIGGDPCTVPLLRATAAAWRQKVRVEIINRGFDGQYATKKRPAAYVWGIGDGVKPAGNTVAIGRDAVVVIVRRGHRSAPEIKNGGDPLMDYDTIRKLFSSSHNHHVYSFDQHSGTRAFFTRMMGIDGKPMTISNDVTIVKDDWEMVQKVGQDVDGIGYCSASAVDLSKYNVPIVDLQLPDGRIVHYPQSYPTGDYKRRAIIPATPTWPLMRTLYAVSTLPKDNHFVDEMLAPGSPGNKALQAGPLFKTSYYRPLAEP